MTRNLPAFLALGTILAGTARGEACRTMDSVLNVLAHRDARAFAAVQARNNMEAEGMRAELLSSTVTGSAQAFLAGSEGLRAEATLDRRPWSASTTIESYLETPTEVRLSLGRDLADDTRPRMGRIDSLRAIRDRIAATRAAISLLGRLKEVLRLRMQYRKHAGGQAARERAAEWAVAFAGDMRRLRDRGVLPGHVAKDLDITLVEIRTQALNAGTLARLDALAARTLFGLDEDTFAAIDLDWLAASLAGKPVPSTYQDDLDSLTLEERRITINYYAPGRKRFLVGPAVHLVKGEVPTWRNFGLQLGMRYEFGKPLGPIRLPAPTPQEARWEAWSSLRDSSDRASLDAQLDSAVSQSVRIAALEPATGYLALNELIRKKVSVALSSLEAQEKMGQHLLHALNRLKQLEEGCR